MANNDQLMTRIRLKNNRTTTLRTYDDNLTGKFTIYTNLYENVDTAETCDVPLPDKSCYIIITI